MEEDNYYFDEFIVMLAYSNDLFKKFMLLEQINLKIMHLKKAEFNKRCDHIFNIWNNTFIHKNHCI